MMEDEASGSVDSRQRRRVGGALAEEDGHVFRYASRSPGSTRKRQATRDFILQSPQYPAIETRRGLSEPAEQGASTSFAGQSTLEVMQRSESEERTMLIEELAQLETSIERLQRRHKSILSDFEREKNAAVMVDTEQDIQRDDEMEDYETLETMLKDMDDAAL